MFESIRVATTFCNQSQALTSKHFCRKSNVRTAFAIICSLLSVSPFSGVIIPRPPFPVFITSLCRLLAHLFLTFLDFILYCPFFYVINWRFVLFLFSLCFPVFFYWVVQYTVGRNSVVSIATCYGLDGPGIESRCERDFTHTSRPVLGLT